MCDQINEMYQLPLLFIPMSILFVICFVGFVMVSDFDLNN